MMDFVQADQASVAHTYKRFPVAVASGKGSLLYDTDGKRYIDMGTGIAVNAFGVSDDTWVAAVTAQLQKVQHTSNLYYTEPCARLASMLCERTGMKKVFFGNSGAEANECAIKAARKYGAEKKGLARPVIITLKNSFHGRTLTTLAATGQEHYHELFQPLTPGFVHAEAGNMDEIRTLVQENDVAAVLVECVQGEGGVIPLDPVYMQELRAFTEAEDILLMVDEVQTGNGRSGALYAYMTYGIRPDVVSTAKGLGGGLPIGACLLGEKVEDIFGYGDHGSTFGGNPVCCAGAVSVLERLDDACLADVRRKSAYVFDRLTGAPGVEAVSGLGLMIGVKTVKPAAEVLQICMDKGVLCLTAKDKIRLLPALNIPDELLAEAVDVLLAACAG